MIELLRDQRFLIILGIGVLILFWCMTKKNDDDFDSLKTEGDQDNDQFLHSRVESDHLIKNGGGNEKSVACGGRGNWWKNLLGGRLQLAEEGGCVEEINSSLGQSKVRNAGFLEGVPQVWTAEGDHLTRVNGCDQII